MSEPSLLRHSESPQMVSFDPDAYLDLRGSLASPGERYGALTEMERTGLIVYRDKRVHMVLGGSSTPST